MFKILNLAILGISSRINELVEMSLTFGFQGVDIELPMVLAHAQIHGPQYAYGLIGGARSRSGGFDLPVRFQGDEAEFATDIAKLPEIAKLCREMHLVRAYSTIQPTSSQLAYPANFELHRKRILQVADILSAEGIRLGLSFVAPESFRKEGEYPFVYQAEALSALVKAVGSPDVGVVLDVWHWVAGGGTVDSLQQFTADQVIAVRLSDGPSDKPAATWTYADRYLPGASGAIDSVEVLKWLNSIGYDGPVGAHCNPANLGEIRREAVIQKLSESLNEIWGAAGVKPPTRPTGRPVVVA
jgi:sugar phosphate isomerase/epimerase